MGSFEVIKRNGEKVRLQSREPFCAVKSAVQNTSLMGDDNVQLSFVSSELIELEKGDKILVFGEEYTLRTKATREAHSEDHYTYEATFYGVMYELMKSLYRNTDANGRSTKSTFDLTYSIKDFIKVLIYNVERDYPGLWKFDETNCPDTEPKTIQFSKQNCLQALQTLCSKENFNLDFQITQRNGVRTIHIGKFGSKVVPPGGNAFFEWGKGSGLYKLKEEKVDDKAIITRLWVEGGTTNIRSGYRDYSERLQLPYPRRKNKRKHTLSDGTIIPAKSEYIGIDDDSKRYFEDAELRDKIGSDEDSKEYDNIHPTRTGEVTALVDGDVNSFVDNTMDFDLCERTAEGTKYLIAGVTAKINFITGKLAGQQFELEKDGGYIHSKRKFKLIAFTDERGLTIPTTGDNEAFRISVGDKYKITDINLPDSYVQNAEEDLWYAGYDDFQNMKQARAQYQLMLDRKYFLDSLPNDSDTVVFKVGDYVPVRDTRFGIEKNIRIQKVSRNLLLEHDYSLTLSDVTTVSVLGKTVVDVIEHNQVIANNRLRDLNKARKSWRTTEELRNMVYDTDGYFDSENIRPNSIETNMLTVGSKSQQFVLVGVVLEANVNGQGNRLKASSGELAHLSIDKDSIRRWNMGGSEFTIPNSSGYYLFAKCSKSGDSGVWYLTQEPLKFEITEDPNNYYFQVGILSSLYSEGFRDFVTTYGFTRINGNTITTGKIITSDGQCYLDLDGNTFRIGNSKSSLEWRNERLIIKGSLVQSPSGETSEIGVYRGAYSPVVGYYKGDEVTYSDNGEVCAYRYINDFPSFGVPPTNTRYWSLITKGAKGNTGDKGDSPVLTFQGDYDASKTYYGTSVRVDSVRYNGGYYVARVGAGTFRGQVPTNTTYWSTFGAQFEQVATQLLLAEGANIAGWVFRNNRLESKDGRIYMDGVNGTIRLKGTIQLSTAYEGGFSDVNIFYLPAISSQKIISMGWELDDIGKVCRLYNSSPIGGASYIVRVCAFGITGSIVDTTIGGSDTNYSVVVPPNTTIELTCFELPRLYNGRYYDAVARWDVTSRFGPEQFKQTASSGRYPVMIAMGTMKGGSTNDSCFLDGYWYNGKGLHEMLSVTRQGEGAYIVRTRSTSLPDGYFVFATGIGTNQLKATVQVVSTTEFAIYISDDYSRNDGSCVFMIMDPKWWYKLA